MSVKISTNGGQKVPQSLVMTVDSGLRQSLIPEEGGEGAMISNTRHADALRRALSAIQQVQKGLTEGISGEFLSMDLQDCLTALAEITGEITSEEVLGNIFSHFCIGK